MVTLGLLRALRKRGIAVSSAKSGPDYIDPAYHRAASGVECVNLDAWAMNAAQLRSMAHRQGRDLLLVEGAMGLFDGALDANDPCGKGSVADLAVVLDLPVLLVLDASKQGQTAAAVVAGLAGFRAGVTIVGVILNKIGSAKHKHMLTSAIEAQGFAVLGAIPRATEFSKPSRHLGLVQAVEDPLLERFIENAAGFVAENVDLDKVAALAMPLTRGGAAAKITPLGQHIAVAQDAAFAFSYPHVLQGWRDAGAAVSFFSPLADQAPQTGADAVFLSGGYPELYAEQLAQNDVFLNGIRGFDGAVYGECGGYMVLGDSLTDASGHSHKMLGLLPVSTSFAERKLHLGYRNLTALAGPFKGQNLKAHEFHYATITEQSTTGRLFTASDSLNHNLGQMGHIRGNISGSFAHIIC